MVFKTQSERENMSKTPMRMAIVSSFSDSCGNAAFTTVLRDSIERYSPISVDVAELNLSLTQSMDRRFREAAQHHLKELCKTLRQADGVNIQFEAGLYGTYPGDIVRRLKMLASANKNTSVTLHAPRLVSSSASDARKGIKKILTLKVGDGMRDLIGSQLRKVGVRINKQVIEFLARRGCRLIVHTERAREQIKAVYRYDNIDVHPLRIIQHPHADQPNLMRKLRHSAGIADSDTVIGMFGYISAYKGHLDALEAIRLLPPNYKLLVFGRQHPQTLKTDGKVDEYLQKLQVKVLEKGINDRVFFMGELGHEDFLAAAASVDVVWLPYYENGQDGSGIASICLELAPRVLCSTSFAFDELFRLIRYRNCERFDIGNMLELAKKTEMLMRRETPSKPYGDESTYTLRSQALMYARSIGWRGAVSAHDEASIGTLVKGAA
jgi:glycosyltransferase involved in cell wall biosynthesis